MTGRLHGDDGPAREPRFDFRRPAPAPEPGPERAVDEAAWLRLQDTLRAAVPATVFDVWLARLEPESYDGTTLVLTAPRPYARHIVGRFARVLATAGEAALGANVTIEIVGVPTEPAPGPRVVHRP